MNCVTVSGLLALAVAACSPAPSPADAGHEASLQSESETGGSDAAASDAPDLSRDVQALDTAPLVPEVYVFGHSRSTLYRLEPRTRRVTRVGDFNCVSVGPDSGDSADGMTDIAIDRDGAMYGVGRGAPGAAFHMLVRVDIETGRCTRIGDVMFEGVLTQVQGLGFVPAGTIDPAREALMGVDNNGNYLRIDPGSAVATRAGVISVASDTRGGDFVSIIGGGTYLIASGNRLVTFNPSSGAALAERTIIETPGDALGMGLGYWGGTVYAFTILGRIYAIDTRTGMTTEVPLVDAPPGLSFRGAAVTTAAPNTPG